MPSQPAQDAVERAAWALAQSKAQTLANDTGPARTATSDDLEEHLAGVARLLRTRPAGDAPEWTQVHALELADAIGAGAELAWRGKAEKVAAEADPAIRHMTVEHEAPSRRGQRRPIAH